jgi:MFS family permease
MNSVDKTILWGNAMDHFDSALYSFLVPIIATIFFPHQDPLVSIIMGYSVLGTSIVTRPLGTIIFGWMAHHQGALRILSYSLMGSALAGLSIAFIPGYPEWGVFSPLCLIMLRFIRGIFSAGESTLSKIYIMENKEKKQSLKASYYYPLSSMFGMILASLTVVFLIIYDPTGKFWRPCFLVNGLSGIIGWIVRKRSMEKIKNHKRQFKKIPLVDMTQIWSKQYHIIWKVFITTGLSHITSVFPFILFNTLIPLMTEITLKTMMIYNTGLLILDFCLIPFLGRYMNPGNYIHFLKISSGILAISLPVLFFFIHKDSSVFYLTIVRIWIIFWGVMFLCPQHFYYYKTYQGPQNLKYLSIGMGNALGGSLMGRLTPMIATFIYYKTNTIGWVGVYGALIACLCFITINKTSKST